MDKKQIKRKGTPEMVNINVHSTMGANDMPLPPLDDSAVPDLGRRNTIAQVQMPENTLTNEV